MYENAQYLKGLDGVVACIRVDINGTTNFVPLDINNNDYANIMQLVNEGKLVIQPAEENK